MRMVLAFLVVVLVFSLVLICGGVVIGSLLRVVFPSVDRGMSILIGVIACTASIRILTLLFEQPHFLYPPKPGADGGFEDGEDDDDLGGEPEPVRPPVWILPPSDQPSGKRRRRRR
jgi:hypothetical protein